MNMNNVLGDKRYRAFGRTPQVVPGEWRQVGGALRIDKGTLTFTNHNLEPLMCH